MGYQALLFCPDEKTARTVTQVLSELDFEVVPCTEPFAAVKQMMAAHFDAIVVDCDNEQNATLLFKSARNAPNNQSALAVAVVEGQAGVAKAFRIGANLVLTRPINVEQAKGTLRVARGLLRKNETAKAAGANATAAAKIAAPEPPVKLVPKAPAIEATKSGFSTIPAPMAAENIEPKGESNIEPETEPQIEAPIGPGKIGTTPAEPKPSFATQASAPAIEMSKSKESQKVEATPVRPLSARSSVVTSTGAASAPAPAREVKPSDLTVKKSSDIILEPPTAIEKTADAAVSADAETTSTVPAFAIGKTQAASPGSKKMLLSVAVIVVLAAAGYLAWMQFGPGAKRSTPSAPLSELRTSPVAPSATLPASAPAPATVTTAVDKNGPAALEQPGVTPTTPTATTEAPKTHAVKPNTTIDTADGAAPVAKTAKPPVEAAAPRAINIKNSAAHETTATEDASPPAITAMPSASGGPMPSLMDNASSTLAPRLQTLNVSQGVSRGLLVKQVQPTYPADAMRLNIEGQVQLMATISKSGEISSVKILSGDSRLAHAAAEAVKQWKYKPYLLNGEPVEIQTQVMINFKLPH
jgi:TonB family protein